MADDPGRPTVDVVYARPERQYVVRVELEHGMTVLDAVDRSGLLETHAGIERDRLVLGVYGTRVPLAAPARAGQRIEICRPLEVDPRDARRELARHGGVMGGRRKPEP